MLVYPFIDKEHALSNIENSWLKIATINDLNDPFEFYVNFTSSEEPLDEQLLNDVKDNYSKKVGFLCFSKRWSNPVQWAHYANKHKGLCLEFEIPKILLLKIKYRRHPITIEANNSTWQQDFVKSTKTKYKHWRYEKEYRMVVNLESDNIQKQNGLLFMPFSSDLKLKSVISGVNCELSLAEKTMLKSNGISLVATKKSRTTYSIQNA